MIDTSPKPAFSFLHTSEAGLYINNINWSEHELGEIDSWDTTLLHTLNVLLESGFPMFLYWGDANICFYNDAFKPSFGSGKNQNAGIGKPLADVFPEVFEEIDSLIRQVKHTGERVFFDDVPSIINRDGTTVNTYWTYSYSPVKDLAGNIKGVLAVCLETTKKNQALHLAGEYELSFKTLFSHAPVGILIVRGADRIIDFANDLYLSIIDKDESCFGHPLWKVIPEIAEQGFDKIMHDVFETGKSFKSAEHQVRVRRNGAWDTGYYTFSYEAVREANGTIGSVIVIVVDVTEQVLNRKNVEVTEQRLRQAVEATQIGTFDYNLITEELIANERFYQIFGFVYNAPHGGIVETIHPEDRKIREAAHRRAYATGHLSYESRIVWKNKKVRWIKASGNVMYDVDRTPLRIVGSVIDITEDKEMRNKLTETAERLDLALRAGKLGTFEWDIKSSDLVCNDQCKADFGLTPEEPFNLPIFLASIVPDDKDRVKTALEESIKNCAPYQAEYRVTWRDKSVHCIRASGLPVCDKKGNVVRMIGVTKQVTEEVCTV